MKIFIYLSATFLTLFFVSCDKSKECDCNQISIITTPGFDTDTMTATTTNTIQEGECSDLDATQSQSFMGQTTSTTLTCVEL